MKVRQIFFLLIAFSSVVPVHAMSVFGRYAFTGNGQQPVSLMQKRNLHVRQLRGAELLDTVEKCPVAGRLLIESGYVRNLGKFGDLESPTVQLVNRLFHENQNIFAPSISKCSPALSITPERAADLVKSLDNSVKISKKDREKVVAEWRSDHEKITSGEKLTKSQITRLLDLIELAKNEQDARIYPAPILPWIISGFAAAKAENHTEIERYLARLGHASSKVSDYSVYELQCATSTYDLLKESGIKIAVCHLLKAQGYFSSELPPVVSSSSCAYKDQKAVPTCQENALRSLINIFVYDSAARRYDCARLPETCTVHDDLKKFYAKHSSVDRQNERDAAQDFMNIVSGLSNIKYGSGEADAQYELRPSIENIFTLLNRFLCNNSARNFNDIATAISSDHQQVNFKIDQESDNSGQITVTIKKHNSKETSVWLKVTNRHAWLERPFDNYNNNFLRYRYGYLALIDASIETTSKNSNNRAARALMQMACFENLDRHGDSIDRARDAKSYQQFLLFSNALQQDSDMASRVNLMLDFMGNRSILVSKEFADQIKRLIDRGDGEAIREGIYRKIVHGNWKLSWMGQESLHELFNEVIAHELKSCNGVASYSMECIVKAGLHKTNLCDKAFDLYGANIFKWAIWNDSFEVLSDPRIKAERFINMSMFDSSSLTPIECAVENSDSRIINFLLQLDKASGSFDRWRIIRNLFKREKFNGDSDIERIVKLLKNHGCIVNGPIGDLSAPLQYFAYKYLGWGRGYTLLHDFAYGELGWGPSCAKSLKFIIQELGIDVEARNLYGQTAHEIARKRKNDSITNSLEEALG